MSDTIPDEKDLDLANAASGVDEGTTLDKDKGKSNSTGATVSASDLAVVEESLGETYSEDPVFDAPKKLTPRMRYAKENAEYVVAKKAFDAAKVTFDSVMKAESAYKSSKAVYEKEAAERATARQEWLKSIKQETCLVENEEFHL